jgi:hypothetical protein
MAFQKKWKNDSGTKTYFSWRSMKHRCTHPSNASWEYYGGRGVKVCDRWLNDFDAFVEDMGFAEDGQSLDRIDPNKGYSPENCRWATSVEQARNKREHRRITYRGQTKLLVEWAELLGVSSDTLHKRLSRMSPSKALAQDGVFTGKTIHGTRTAYSARGCRCDICRKGNTERARKQRALRRLRAKASEESA